MLQSGKGIVKQPADDKKTKIIPDENKKHTDSREHFKIHPNKRGSNADDLPERGVLKREPPKIVPPTKNSEKKRFS